MSYIYEKGLNERIRTAREALDLSRTKMSIQMGYSKTFISKVERTGDDGFIPEYIVLNICNTFGVNPNYLLKGEKPMFSRNATSDIDKVYLEMPEEDRKSVLRFARFILMERKQEEGRDI